MLANEMHIGTMCHPRMADGCCRGGLTRDRSEKDVSTAIQMAES
jgi:hypothetical protein